MPPTPRWHESRILLHGKQHSGKPGKKWAKIWSRGKRTKVPKGPPGMGPAVMVPEDRQVEEEIEWPDYYEIGQEPEFLNAELPWPRTTAELMIDATSITKYYLAKQQEQEEDLVLLNDPYRFWPFRLFQACKLLRQHYGWNVPPSPWEGIVLVHDIPGALTTLSGNQVKRWGKLAKQGPFLIDKFPGGIGSNVTLAFSQTFVSTIERELPLRADSEIMYMLDLLKTNIPNRRQILVTNDPKLVRRAEDFVEVRGPTWLEQEILRCNGGELAVKALLSDVNAPLLDDVEHMDYHLPRVVAKAWQSG